MKVNKAIICLAAALVMLGILTGEISFAGGSPPCVTFDGPPGVGPIGTRYPTGSLFSDSGVRMACRPFQWSSGTWFHGGYAEVTDAGLVPGGSGKEIFLNNTTLFFLFGGPAEAVKIPYRDSGGNINLVVNRKLFNEDDFISLHGISVSGVKIFVNNLPGENAGEIELTGKIRVLGIGGQELSIDNICYKK